MNPQNLFPFKLKNDFKRLLLNDDSLPRRLNRKENSKIGQNTKVIKVA